MAIKISAAARNAALDAVVDRIDAGAAAGVLRLYSGAPPASPETAASGTLLATFTLTDPAFEAATGGSVAIDADPDIVTTAVADGTAGYMRAQDSDGVAVFDGTVGVAGSGADFIITAVAISNGQQITLISGSITFPA